MTIKEKALEECGFCGHPKGLHESKGKRKCKVEGCRCKKFLTVKEFISGFVDFNRKKNFRYNLLLFIVSLIVFLLAIGSIGGLLYLIKLIF